LIAVNNFNIFLGENRTF